MLAGNPNYLPSHTAVFDELIGLPTALSIVRCLDCGFQFSSTIPSAPLLDFDYGEVNVTDLSRSKLYESERRRDRTAIWLNILRMFDRPLNLRVVDFGCGWGDFLAIAKAPGVDVVGVEQNPRQVEFARAHGIDVVASIDDLEPETVDVVIANQVLEHVLAPTDLLRGLRRLLRHGGVGYFSVPDFTRFNWRRAQRDLDAGRTVNRLINPWEHLNYFSHARFLTVVRQAGFAPEREPVAALLERFARLITSRRAGLELYVRVVDD